MVNSEKKRKGRIIKDYKEIAFNLDSGYKYIYILFYLSQSIS